MRRPEPKRVRERFVKQSNFRFGLELVLDFDHPVSIEKGREAARKLLDSLRIDGSGYATPEALGDVSLKCSSLRRLIRVEVPEPVSEDL